MNTDDMFATSLIRLGYQHLAKPVFFQQDPENIHDRIIKLGFALGSSRLLCNTISAFLRYDHPSLEQTLVGIPFKNPIGLAAGFDKNAHLTRLMGSVGFGFEEIGSMTGEPCPGNPKPRLWRLPKSKGLVVNYGLKNDGCEAIAKRLERETFNIPIGVSIAKTNSPKTVEIEAGMVDYKKAFERFLEIGAYFTINISCPNAYGGEPFIAPDRLHRLLAALDPVPTKKPIFIKMPADISFEELAAIIRVCYEHRVHGFIFSNLTKRRDRPEINQDEIRGITKGGISGKPTFDASNQLIQEAYRLTRGGFVLIGCGGIFSAEDAYKKIRCGASLLQLITGMIFEGPQLIGEINRGLVALLKRDGYKNIAEAVGAKVCF